MNWTHILDLDFKAPFDPDLTPDDLLVLPPNWTEFVVTLVPA